MYNDPIYDMWMNKNGKLTLVTKRISLNCVLHLLEDADPALLEVANPMFAPVAMRKQLRALAKAVASFGERRCQVIVIDVRDCKPLERISCSSNDSERDPRGYFDRLAKRVVLAEDHPAIRSASRNKLIAIAKELSGLDCEFVFAKGCGK